MKKIKVLIADDHELLRLGLRALIERQPQWRVCGVAKTGTEAVKEAVRLLPDVAVVDYGLPGLNGAEVTREIKRRVPQCEVLIFTGSADSDALIREAFRSGAKSFILKAEAGKYLVDAIEHLADHRPFFTDKASAIVFANFAAPARKRNVTADSDGRLTADEIRLVRLLSDGASNAEVARKQRLSEKVVENKRAAIMRKLQFKTFADLVRYAVRNGIIKA